MDLNLITKEMVGIAAPEQEISNERMLVIAQEIIRRISNFTLEGIAISEGVSIETIEAIAAKIKELQANK